MPELSSIEIQQIFDRVGATASVAHPGGLTVTAPATGGEIASVKRDDPSHVEAKVALARAAQSAWQTAAQAAREAFLKLLSATVQEHQEALARLITLEGGKPKKDAMGEAGRASAVLAQTVVDNSAAISEVAGAQYREMRKPVGVVGLITSYNFPLAVANWTIAPALLAGNAVVWKPSEKTPLTAIAYKGLFDRAVEQFNRSCSESVSGDLVQIVIGEREVGQALVASAGVNMVSATGSVGMGKAVLATLAGRSNACAPILELGGNNAVIISDKLTSDGIRYAASKLMQSTVFGGGQLCTCTRRVIAHERIYDEFADAFRRELRSFVDAGGVRSSLTVEPDDDAFCYAPLIDKDAYGRFARALEQSAAEGGEVTFGGGRVLVDEYAGAYYVVPALVEMPRQTAIMHEETFGPLVYLTPYGGEIDNAITIVNEPSNAALVNGVYTTSRAEADRFAALNQAGHGVINGVMGTRAPMVWAQSFGGNKDSGSGCILHRGDPLRAFTRTDGVSRVSVHSGGIVME